MKTSLLSLILILFCTSLIAQDKYSSYNTYIGKTFDISVKKRIDGFNLYIDAYSSDPVVEKGGFVVAENDLKRFISNLRLAQTKYNEWVSVAKENNVNDLIKEVDVKYQKYMGYFMSGGKWNFDSSVKLSYFLKIYQKEDDTTPTYLLTVQSGKLQASTNTFIDSKDMFLLFTSSEEIDTFINLLSVEKINAFLEKTATKKDLFK